MEKLHQRPEGQLNTLDDSPEPPAPRNEPAQRSNESQALSSRGEQTYQRRTRRVGSARVLEGRLEAAEEIAERVRTRTRMLGTKV